MLVKPDAYVHIGKIMADVCKVGFMINRVQMVRFNQELVRDFYAEHVSKPYFAQIEQSMTADVVVGLEVLGNNVIQ